VDYICGGGWMENMNGWMGGWMGLCRRHDSYLRCIRPGTLLSKDNNVVCACVCLNKHKAKHK